MAQLIAVMIETPTPGNTVDVYRAACGVEPIGEGEETVFRLGNATVSLRASARTAGVVSVTILVDELTARRTALSKAGIEVVETESGISISKDDTGGVTVLLVESATLDEFRASARLDHVALRVRSLVESSGRWQTITGVEPLQMGVHPVSNGAFSAARVLLGERMIELISPEPDVPSQIADRLRNHGEGAAALALPVDDVTAALNRLEEVGARVLRQDPHWMIHPKDAGGVLVQLTPRVAH